MSLKSKFTLNIFLLICIYKASSQELYIGCYKSFSGTLSRLNRIRSVSQCLTECRSQLSLFTAIAGGSSCYCGVMETNTRVPSSNCNKTCIDNNGICGGNNFFAVYTGVPAYQGCFRDNNYDRDLINMIMNDQRMTIDKCYEICSSNNYKYSGVQYAKECFCGQQYGRHGKVSESDCDMSCSGDANQICGGGSRNSVYSVGYLQGLNQGYSEVFHCLNGATNLHGTCINISCQRGWKGTKCNQRDCTINNGNCGRHKCQEIIIGNQVISECVCEEGFRSISIYDECKDIDECTFNVCDIKTSTCSNTIGSYNCICKEGFARHLSNQFLCEVSYEEFYIGCNRNFSGISIKKYPIQSISQCLNECKRQASSFAALKDGSSCYCGNTTNRRVPSSNCNSPCSDNNGICGGNNLFAVYTDIPTYQGCFKDDNNNRDMNLAIHGDWTMTIEKCYERCSSTNYSFMGVQIGGFCYCGQQYGKHGRAPETECNVACNGNGNQICGGPARNSIYSVGQIPGLNKNYSELFHCLNGATDKNGTCSSKTCQHGWKGKKCNQRDCITNNGNCGQHKCAEIKIGNQIISECVCKEGFQSISIYNDCTDIDECQRSPCNEPSETCNNTVGSYMCTCSPGYNYINQLGCKDQCNGSLYECENSTTCVEVQNYKCSSKDSNFSESLSNDKKVIILATFLVLSLSALVIATAGLLFCKRKVRELQAKLMKQKNTIQGSAGNNSISTYQQLDASSPSKDPHNYSELVASQK